MEGFKMQLKVEAGHIVKVLLKPQTQRMPFEGVQIAKSLSRIPLINNFFQTKSEPFVSMCISSQIKTIQQGQQIYEKLEQQPTAIYLILQGKALVKQNQQSNDVLKNLSQRQKDEKSRKPIQSIIHLRQKHKYEFESDKALKTRQYQISQFDHFGQVEVIFNIPKRNQKILAQTDCKIMVLKASQLKDIWKDQILESTGKFMHYIEVHPYFEDLSPYSKQMLSLIMIKKTFTQGDRIVRQGQNLQNVMFIVYGSISVIKNLLMRDTLKNSLNTSLKINELTEMQTVGEFECVNQCPSQVTLIAQNFGCYYHLKYNELLKFNHPILTKIQQKALPYPNDNELQFMFKTKIELKAEQTKIERQNKIGFKNKNFIKSCDKKFGQPTNIYCVLMKQ